MKTMLRVFSSLLLAAGLFCGGAVTVSAANQSGTTQMYLPSGSGAAIQFSSGRNSFFNFTGVVPGDTLTQNIEIKNQRGEAVTFYLNAASPMENEALLREINMTITNTGTGQVIYSGNLTGQPTTAYGDDLYKNSSTQLNGVNLGSFGANSTLSLKVNIFVPIAVDNTFADNLSKVTWQVRARTADPSYPDGSSSSSRVTGDNAYGYPDAGNDLAYISENDVPLAGDLYTIPNSQVPLSDLPRTGGAPGPGRLLSSPTRPPPCWERGSSRNCSFEFIAVISGMFRQEYPSFFGADHP